VVVTDYTDTARGTLTLDGTGAGRVTEVTLAPSVTVKGSVPADMEALHHRASELCFIANSVNFPVRHTPETLSSGSL
jgi:organic hydroperoxide reductase OsmC/OhrA